MHLFKMPGLYFMSMIKKFHVRHVYYRVCSSYNGDDIRNTETNWPVTASNYESILRNLKLVLNNQGELRKLLQAEFIYPGVIETSELISRDTFPKNEFNVETHFRVEIDRTGKSSLKSYQVTTDTPNPDFGYGCKDTETYEKYKVASVLEMLIVDHPEEFTALVAAASPQARTELLNFTNLDINIPAIAHQAEVHEDAQLPVGIWSAEKKNKVLQNIAQLNAYGEKLGKSHFESGREKGELAIQLAARLSSKMSSTRVYNATFEEEFLGLLHGHDASFNEPRFHGFKMIIANIALCILGVGVGYLAAGLYHQQKTGRFAFFSRPETQQLVDGVDMQARQAMAG